MNLNMDNCWGIISGLVNLCQEQLEHDGEAGQAWCRGTGLHRNIVQDYIVPASPACAACTQCTPTTMLASSIHSVARWCREESPGRRGRPRRGGAAPGCCAVRRPRRLHSLPFPPRNHLLARLLSARLPPANSVCTTLTAISFPLPCPARSLSPSARPCCAPRQVPAGPGPQQAAAAPLRHPCGGAALCWGGGGGSGQGGRRQGRGLSCARAAAAAALMPHPCLPPRFMPVFKSCVPGCLGVSMEQLWRARQGPVLGKKEEGRRARGRILNGHKREIRWWGGGKCECGKLPGTVASVQAAGWMAAVWGL